MIKGNFYKENKHDGWIMGFFADEPFKTDSFEIKLGNHLKGKTKNKWGTNKTAKSLCILIYGKLIMKFKGEDVVLSTPGDYVFWDSGVAHSWELLEDTKTISIRWPSIEGDQI